MIHIESDTRLHDDLTANSADIPSRRNALTPSHNKYKFLNRGDSIFCYERGNSLSSDTVESQRKMSSPRGCFGIGKSFDMMDEIPTREPPHHFNFDNRDRSEHCIIQSSDNQNRPLNNSKQVDNKSTHIDCINNVLNNANPLKYRPIPKSMSQRPSQFEMFWWAAEQQEKLSGQRQVKSHSIEKDLLLEAVKRNRAREIRSSSLTQRSTQHISNTARLKGSSFERGQAGSNMLIENNDEQAMNEYLDSSEYDSRDHLQSVVTALYCKMLVILGIAFPMTEVISTNVPIGTYQFFYIYLFSGSLFYLGLTYIDLMRTKAKMAITKKAAKSATEAVLRRQKKKADDNMLVDCLKHTIDKQCGNETVKVTCIKDDKKEELKEKLLEADDMVENGVVNIDDIKKRKESTTPSSRSEEEEEKDVVSVASEYDKALNDLSVKRMILRPRVNYGSFYLRIGAVVFGIGSMIYTGIEIGSLVEIHTSHLLICHSKLEIFRPFLQMIFVFVQMYFVFVNQKMNVYKNKLLSRMGLMHMIATNLCVWINVLVLETSHEITTHQGVVNSLKQMHAAGGGYDVGIGHHQLSRSFQFNESTLQSHYKGIEDVEKDATGQGAVGHLIGRHAIVKAAAYYDDHGRNNHHKNSFNLPSSILSSTCIHIDNIQDLESDTGEAYYELMMIRLLADSGPFLFPCTIEYSLICAAILFVMWKNINPEHKFYITQRNRKRIAKNMNINIHSLEEAGLTGDGHSNSWKPAHYYSVDCRHASSGLFVGLLVLVAAIISLIIFFVLKKDSRFEGEAVNVAAVTELLLYAVATVAVVIGMFQTQKLWYDNTRKIELDVLLLVVSQTGIYIYATFCLIGTFFQIEKHYVSFIASVLTFIQTTFQTIFIINASNRFAKRAEHVDKKPGRQVVTFLLVCNLAMWTINTLETNRADSHPIQSKFYGSNWCWPIITHISMPLAIFYRFHSTVCLCDIWKKAFKYKSLVTNQY